MVEGYIAPAVLAEKAGMAINELASGLGPLRERARAAAGHLYGPRWIVEHFPESERDNAQFVQETLANAHKTEVSDHDLQRAVDMLRVLEDDLNEVMFRYRFNLQDGND